jgi:hypothetical protein
MKLSFFDFHLSARFPFVRVLSRVTVCHELSLSRLRIDEWKVFENFVSDGKVRNFQSCLTDRLTSQIHFLLIFSYKIFPKKIIRYFEYEMNLAG